MLFRERLLPGPGLFLAVSLLVPAGLLALMPIGVVAGVVGALVLGAAGIAFLLLTTPTIEVTGETLRAGRATLPRRFVGEAVAIRGQDAFIARGQQLDARAYTLLRGFIKDVVRVENTDPDDPAPYWLLSTRRPDDLVAALERR